jgi:putative ABC transport system permease protein
MERLRNDARIALRGFRRTPGFLVAVTLILGIGIGMAAATVTVYDAVLLRRLPVVAQDRVVLPRVYDKVGVAVDLVPQQITVLAHSARTMGAVAGVMHAGAVESPLDYGERTLLVHWTSVSGNFFDVLGTHPLLGRLIRTDDDVAGAPWVMVLSYGAWQRMFGGDPAVIGRTLSSASYATSAYRIIGVTPPGLDYPAGVDGWVANAPIPGTRLMNVVARLTPSATPDAAAAEVLSIMRTWNETGKLAATAHAQSATLPQAIVGDVKPALNMLGAAVALLLIIVCVNIGNLMLSRAAGRAREIAVRRALSASSGDIARQLIVESAMLAAIGGGLGFVVAESILRALVKAAPANLPRLDVISLGIAPLLWCAAVTVLTVLLFGVAPAFLAARGDLASPLRFDARSGRESRGQRAFRQSLVAAQVAIALVVLTGGGLLVRSFVRLENIRLGFTPEHLSFLEISMPWDKIGTSYEKTNAMYDALERQVRAVPGVVAVSPSLASPFQLPELFLGKVMTETGPASSESGEPLLPITIGGPDVFRTLGISLLRGRGFLPGEGTETSPRLAVVSHAAARLLFPGEDPVGKRFRSPFDTSARAWVTVVGEADDARYRKLKEVQPIIYLPWRQFFWQGTVAVRTTRPIALMEHELDAAIRSTQLGMKLDDAHPAAENVSAVLASPRMSATLLSALGLVATLLAAIGLYAVMAAAVREQTREIGVRMALGATPERVRGDVMRAALGVAAIGAAIGVALSFAASQLLSGLVFDLSTSDPVSYAAALIVVGIVAVIAAYVPARRATRIDPVQALRAD